MIDAAPDTLVAVFAIFCRIAGCLLVMPGFSNNNIPTRVRLFVALGISLALSPMLVDTVRPGIGDGSPAALLWLIFAETLTGFLIGFVGRLFFSALQTIGMAIASFIGFNGIPGTVTDDFEQMPSLPTLFTLTATVLLFIGDLHWEVLRGLIDSYATIPAGAGIPVRLGLVEIADQITAAFLLALRIGSPFLIYSLIVNFAVGITNKLTPQVPVFFIAMPFVTAGGMVLLFFTVSEFMASFMAAFAAWLARG